MARHQGRKVVTFAFVLLVGAACAAWAQSTLQELSLLGSSAADVAQEPERSSAVAAALAPLTGIPGEYRAQVAGARDQMALGWRQFGAGEYVQGATNEALGLVGYVASPVNAVTRSIAGRPVENVALACGAEPAVAALAGEVANLGAGVMVGTALARSANALVGASARAPVAPVRTTGTFRREIDEGVRQLVRGGRNGEFVLTDPVTGNVAETSVEFANGRVFVKTFLADASGELQVLRTTEGTVLQGGTLRPTARSVFNYLTGTRTWLQVDGRAVVSGRGEPGRPFPLATRARK